ncbi:MAG: hypothetical protein QOG53_1073 [Frankiales bacterium]|jgi:D-alanyl-D-alanine carboxypeptidase (penicillin-binding protein 5/6)|nr:hypothetical protein [Frankiales bacterium]
MRLVSLPRVVLCAGLACASSLVLATPGTAAVRAGSDGEAGPVGGAQMASRGVVVDAQSRFAKPPVVVASSWVIADLDSGDVLAARNPHGRFAPASTLKTLTAVTFIPRMDPDQLILVPYEAGAVDGTKVGVVPGGKYPVRELMMSMLIVSANDSATTIASAQQPLSEGLKLMNEEAARLHARDTFARNPSGLDAKGQLSSSYDLALIGRAGMNMPEFRRYVSTKRSSISAPKKKRYEIYTHNHLLLNYPGTLGIKNGYTVAAKASFVGAAERGGHRLIVALMHGTPLLWKEAARLLNWGFAVDGRIAPVGRLVDPAPMPGDELATGAPPGGVSASTARPASGGLDLPVAPLVAAGAVVLLFAALRLRARRRRGHRFRSRSKFSLPPL